MKKIIFLVPTFLLLNTAWGFTLNYSPNVFFPNSKVTVNISSGSCGSADITTDDIKNWITAVADDYWNTVSTSSLELKVGSIIGTDLTGVTDTTFENGSAFSPIENNTILVGCNDMGTNFNVSSGVLAGASIASTGGKVVGMALINTNADFSDETQNIAVVAHEIGHALGLGHTSDPVALMYYAVGGKTQERLTMDDRDGITYLYPHEKKVPASCGSIALIGNNDNNDSNGSGSGLLSFLVGLLGIAFILNLLKRSKRLTKKYAHGIFSRRQTYSS